MAAKLSDIYGMRPTAICVTIISGAASGDKTERSHAD
jgi:hypothetical protein